MHPDEVRQILALRLMIARAAAADSLGWWEDDALTDAGLGLATRLFPRAPGLARQRLAIMAARARHRAALANRSGAIHLFDLGGVPELALNDALAMSKWPIPAAFATVDDLRVALSNLGVVPPRSVSEPARGGIVVLDPDPEPGVSPLALAQRFASGYVHAMPGQPVFPYARTSPFPRTEPPPGEGR